jgi:hypothetical protein
MPVFEGLTKKTKGPLPRKDGTLPGQVKAPEPPPPPATMRVRILRRIQSTRHGKYEVGQEASLPVDLARSWIGMGLAELDKMCDGAPETK